MQCDAIILKQAFLKMGFMELCINAISAKPHSNEEAKTLRKTFLKMGFMELCIDAISAEPHSNEEVKSF